jgi:ferrochelatase
MIGILVSNLGTPDEPTTRALRRYLAEFLWDRRIVDLPRPLWWLILNGVILPRRPKESARLYRKIWTDEGSPLAVITSRVAEKLKGELENRIGPDFRIAVGMRYGNPSIASALDELYAAGCYRILVIPLYPQYSSATTASTFDAVAAALERRCHLPAIRVAGPWFDEKGYVEALAGSIRAHWESRGEPEKLLFSFHGLPVKLIEKGDPYKDQCLATAALVREALGIDEERSPVAFQSQFGKAEWIGPKTDRVLAGWAGAVKGRVDVICPGFSADCLETLEEIAETGGEDYRKEGGGEYSYIPCLNDSAEHVRFLAGVIEKNLRGWEDG